MLPGDIQGELTEWSVRPDEFGEFLVAIFDHWIKRDVGKIFVMNIEWAFANLSVRQERFAIISQPVGAR
ncbi:arylsulfatase [Escherichia coli]|uniref:Arylsulfatase n=1 Tax=Escherichia coli TaxID=562 RepID=A0A376VRD1_ECOLX|nr:arylsulfatase [Escherichia coli]